MWQVLANTLAVGVIGYLVLRLRRLQKKYIALDADRTLVKKWNDCNCHREATGSLAIQSHLTHLINQKRFDDARELFAPGCIIEAVPKDECQFLNQGTPSHRHCEHRKDSRSVCNLTVDGLIEMWKARARKYYGYVVEQREMYSNNGLGLTYWDVYYLEELDTDPIWCTANMTNKEMWHKPADQLPVGGDKPFLARCVVWFILDKERRIERYYEVFDLPEQPNYKASKQFVNQMVIDNEMGMHLRQVRNPELGDKLRDKALSAIDPTCTCVVGLYDRNEPRDIKIIDNGEDLRAENKFFFELLHSNFYNIDPSGWIIGGPYVVWMERHISVFPEKYGDPLPIAKNRAVHVFKMNESLDRFVYWFLAQASYIPDDTLRSIAKQAPLDPKMWRHFGEKLARKYNKYGKKDD